MQEKAYKVLAKQENISNNQAKNLIDDGLVLIGERKVKVARANVDVLTKFRVLRQASAKVIFEDDNLIAIDKPYGTKSEDIERKFGTKLLHRLDKETSGVLILVKNEEFQKKAISEFKRQRVYKEYRAVVDGIVNDTETIDAPIKTIKSRTGALSSISDEGKSASTEIEPIQIIGKKTKLKVIIHTGRTHQIRVHLQSIGHIIIGDDVYGNKRKSPRLMLHANKIKLFDYIFESPEPREFNLA